MLTFARIATKPAVFQMLTGLSLQAFLNLLPAFHQATAHIEHQAEQRRKQPRKRQPGGGRKPLLRSDADRLLFVGHRGVALLVDQRLARVEQPDALGTEVQHAAELLAAADRPGERRRRHAQPFAQAQQRQGPTPEQRAEQERGPATPGARGTTSSRRLRVLMSWAYS